MPVEFIEEAGNVLRCCDCLRLVTRKALFKKGKCPYCGCARVRGADPTWWESIKIHLGIIK